MVNNKVPCCIFLDPTLLHGSKLFTRFLLSQPCPYVSNHITSFHELKTHMMWRDHLPASRLSDMFGRKPVLMAISFLFLVGSAGCGFSQNLSQLIFFRAVAGLGGGGLVFLPDVLIHDLAPLKNRSGYQSYVTCMNSVCCCYISRKTRSFNL